MQQKNSYFDWSS